MGGAQNPALAYHEYLGPAIFVPMARVTLEAAKPQPGERVLEVACGSGIVTSQLPALVGPTGKVVGVDISPDMLAVAAAQPAPAGPTIQWKQRNGMALDLPSEAFDVVVCQQGLQFFQDKTAGVREMRRVLVDGGRAVVSCWQTIEHQSFFATLLRAQARIMGVPEAKVSVPFSFGNANALRDLFMMEGFSRVEMQTHVIETRFRNPEQFLRMTAGAAVVVMPEVFANVDMNELVSKINAECHDDLMRYSDGEWLKFPMPTNLAIAYA